MTEEVEYEVDESSIDSDPTENSVEPEGEIVPEMWDTKWSDYVLSQLEDDEVIDGNPTTDGLRRITNKVLGPVLSSKPVREQFPNVHNGNHSVVVWEIQILFSDGNVRTFGDVADVSFENTSHEFAKYSSATAATRAEGRALRKALQLKRIIAAEEIDEAPRDGQKINAGQVVVIDAMCKRNDIDVKKLINMGKNKFDKIEDIPNLTALQMIKYLSQCQRGKNDEGKPVIISDSLKGYDPDWRN